MYIYSVRAGTIKMVSVIIIALLLLVFLVSFGTESAVCTIGEKVINYGGMDSNEKRVAFIRDEGVDILETPKIEEVFPVPDDFDRIIAGYNEIQKMQGLDLTKYRGKRVTHYAYEAVNYDYDGVVYVNLYIHKNRIVALDVSSVDGKGFVKPLVDIT